RTGSAILSQPNSALWITAQGRFTDPRVRPVTLRSGTGHLLRRAKHTTVLPLAVEYPFWEERFPEALVRFGEPIYVEDGATFSAEEWTRRLSVNLQRAQDLLAAHSVARDRRVFDVLATGRTGAGAYDLWRALKAIVRGHEFHSAHGPEHLQ
ncbi:MAG: lysophospholipid acyltransferase family protein, partial [Acidobacteriaceae bacterium]|nr:lysophospholipid acyltransferase family protein [Acidobacteriaceae bacterium]